MIRLNVHDYCHNCPEFEPEAEKLLDDNYMCQCQVSCVNHHKCEDIANRIEASIKEKKDGSLADARKNC